MNSMELNKIINENKDSVFTTGGIDDDKIEKIENKLNTKFPESYKWFLRKYGEGIFCGVEIFGAGAKQATIPSCIKYTEIARVSENLPLKFVVVEEIGELSYCIDTSKLNNEECPIVLWNPINENIENISYDNFYTFLYERIIEMI